MAGLKGTILVVDDDPGVVSVMVSILERNGGYKCLSFNSSEAAFERAIENDIDLILMDVHMSGMSGLTFARMLRDKGHKVPIILMSGHIDEAVLTASQELSFVRTYKKEESNDSLVSVVSSSIESAWMMNQVSGLHTKLNKVLPALEGVITVEQVDERLQFVAETLSGKEPHELSPALKKARMGFLSTLSGLGLRHFVKALVKSWAFHGVFWPVLVYAVFTMYSQGTAIALNTDSRVKMERKISTVEERYHTIDKRQQLIQRDVGEIKILLKKGNP